MANLSKTQIDRLGERLRKGSPSEDDLRILEEYRLSFGHAFEKVFQLLRARSLSPTGRPAKSTPSIIEKLHRESIRLSQMQDIAGCRVIVANITEQDLVAASLKNEFPSSISMDRRKAPSHGYRAVHVIVEVSNRPVEIQLRTALQHMWAELSERGADVLDPMIKYGGGPEDFQRFLAECSERLVQFEDLEYSSCKLKASYNRAVEEWQSGLKGGSEGANIHRRDISEYEEAANVSKADLAKLDETLSKLRIVVTGFMHDEMIRLGGKEPKP